MTETRSKAAILPGTEGPLHTCFDGALLDLDGVVYVGPDAVPGAPQALDVVRSTGLTVRFVTNNASRPPEVVADHLTRLGIPATPDEVVTSAQVAAALLARRLPPGAGVLVIGGPGLRDAVKHADLVPMEAMEEGPAAVVQGFSPDMGWWRLAEAARGVRAGLYWMATNLDRTVPTVHGPAPGNGTLVAAVEVAAGRGPDDVAGKPRPGAFLEAARSAGARRPLVVGDRLDTDLEGARAAGMPGLLVLSGVTDITTLLNAAPHVRPTYLGRDLSALLREHPAAGVDGPDGRCRGARARAEVRDGRVRVKVVEVGRLPDGQDRPDPVDLLRAAAVAAWQAADAAALATTGGPGPGPVDAAEVIEAVRAAEPDLAWAR